MSSAAAQFFIALPNSPRAVPKTRRREIPNSADDLAWEEFLPYLRGLPSLPDFLAHLAGYQELTAAEEDCITKQVNHLSQQIREARTTWDETQSDVVASP